LLDIANEFEIDGVLVNTDVVDGAEYRGIEFVPTFQIIDVNGNVTYEFDGNGDIHKVFQTKVKELAQ
jgi:hypothetical protein